MTLRASTRVALVSLAAAALCFCVAIEAIRAPEIPNWVALIAIPGLAAAITAGLILLAGRLLSAGNRVGGDVELRLRASTGTALASLASGLLCLWIAVCALRTPRISDWVALVAVPGLAALVTAALILLADWLLPVDL